MVENPGLVCLHGVPSRVILDRIAFEANITSRENDRCCTVAYIA